MNKVIKIRSPIKQKILLLLAAGLTLGLTRSLKNQRKILRTVAKEWRQLDRQKLYRAVDEFYHERLVDYRELADGTIKVVLTEAGRQTVLKFDFDTLRLKIPKRWDGLWRLVVYDIPHAKRTARHALQQKLQELGFYQWQKSVWVYPYPCRDEIDFVIEFFEVRSYIRYAEMGKISNEAELKLKFNLI